jgi:regulator of sirC expression with transglutaminase-like and TPR domain
MDVRPSFAALAAADDPRPDVLALALAAEFGEVDREAAIVRLDALGHEYADTLDSVEESAAAQCRALAALLADIHGFAGDTERYDDPRNSMPDRVLERRRGLPILLGVVYAEVARRAGVPIAGVGLPGHYVVGHFGTDPALLLDPFGGGAPIRAAPAAVPLVRPWTAKETAMRMLNNLVGSYTRRGHLPLALRAAELRLLLPSDDDLRAVLERELDGLRARLN